MKTLIGLAFVLSLSVSFAKCHLKALGQEEFEKELKSTMLENIPSQRVEEIVESETACHEVLSIIAEDYEYTILSDKLIDVMMKYKVSPSQMQSYVDQDGKRVILANAIVERANSKRVNELKKRVKKLRSYGIQIDHRRVTSYDLSPSAITLEKSFESCSKDYDSKCFEPFINHKVSQNYEALKTNNYKFDKDFLQELKTRLKKLEASDDFIEQFMADIKEKSLLSLGTPLKQAAAHLDLELIKLLLGDGADQSELKYINEFLMSQEMIDHYRSYAIEEDKLYSEKDHKRFEVIQFIEDYLAELDTSMLIKSFSKCLSESILGDAEDREIVMQIIHEIDPMINTAQLKSETCKNVLIEKAAVFNTIREAFKSYNDKVKIRKENSNAKQIIYE